MKLVLLISVCVCIAAVYGRKDHKRTAKEEHERESRHDRHHKMMMRDENHTKKRMMSDAQRNAKLNTAEEKNDDGMNPGAQITIPEMSKRAHMHKASHSKKREDKANVHMNRSPHLNIEQFHKRHHIEDPENIKDAIKMKLQGMTREKFREMMKNMPHADHALERIVEKLDKVEKRKLKKLHNQSTK